jgi:aryl-alcohol dehydrogenase-like predicted oxidoreductase
MKYKQLGKSELGISCIGFGCMSLKANAAENQKIIDAAIEYGINYFDTADIYDRGMNEVFLGQALKNKREKVIIATKAGNQLRPNRPGWDWNPAKDYILKCADESLKRLQIDYIDLFQLHGGTIDDPIDETIEAFEILKQQGKIRHYGLSSIRPNVIREYVKRSNIVSVMTQYSLLDRRPEEETLQLLKDNNIGVVTRGSVASGLLVHKAASNYLNYAADEVQLAADKVRKISGKDRSAAQTAIQYVLYHPAVTAAIIGIRTMEQLEDAVKTIDAPQLSMEEYEELKKAIPPNFYQEHR